MRVFEGLANSARRSSWSRTSRTSRSTRAASSCFATASCRPTSAATTFVRRASVSTGDTVKAARSRNRVCNASGLALVEWRTRGRARVPLASVTVSCPSSKPSSSPARRSACRSSRASSRCIGVTIGVTFLIAVVSIVGGMSRYMKDDLVGKIIAVNSFNLRRQPEHSARRRDEDERARDGAAVRGSRSATSRRSPRRCRRTCSWAVESCDQPQRRIDVRPSRKPHAVLDGLRATGSRSRRWASSKGRLFAPQEYSLGTPVVVIGQDVADHFFPSLEPIGRAAEDSGHSRTRSSASRRSRAACSASRSDKFVIAPDKSPLNRWVEPARRRSTR